MNATLLSDLNAATAETLREYVASAKAHATDIEDSWCECPEDDDAQHVLMYSYWCDQLYDVAFDLLRAHLIDNDIPRNWVATDSQGIASEKFKALTFEEARDAASEWIRQDYVVTYTTSWTDVSISCLETNEFLRMTAEIEPAIPDCDPVLGFPNGRPHDWQSPHSIVGGLKENPGVQGKGGGVLIQEVCMRCGCGKLTDTWLASPVRSPLRESYDRGDLSGADRNPYDFADQHTVLAGRSQ